MSQVLTYKNFINKHKEFSSKVVIPKIIIKTGKWALNDLPEETLQIYNRIININPDYYFVYFDDNGCFSFIKTFYPDYIKCYNKIVPTAYKADLFRYLFLHKYGGCYGDVTQEIFVNYDSICDGFERVFCRDSITNSLGLYNAIMCTIPSDPVIVEVLKICKKNIEEENYTNSPLGITGPLALGEAFMKVYDLTSIELSKQNKSLILDFKKIDDEEFIIDTRCDKAIGTPRSKNHNKLLYKHPTMSFNPFSTHYQDLWYRKRVFRIYKELENIIAQYEPDKKGLTIIGIYNETYRDVEPDYEGTKIIVWNNSSISKIN
jgi:mannosyltransferase OCH1-like enzyme